ncbi:PIN domain-containing protein [Actinosynnema sp. NPDC047251]|uniref:PIN like domain-containing protein n=1 Tax=Saccharothrix espanaensis (strain ATCC 51144 / DSM 44229 / JCM 9112 / NBRC 15066 / NRRL 15764) TaxID=1179773 RepID=K0K2Y7_SACES|nr:PIN domain-containing protein [Saccharothrix espanaensis]CCH31239.1 hypothetical protein BN6_39510 [Saccharothrix espanaensis DSM 44229]
MGADTTPPQGDIFEGFEQYRTPQTEDYQRALAEGLVVLDANVLLNLYRYNTGARDDLLSVMDRIGDHLWVPHQAMREFWRNRDSVLGALRDAAREATATLEKSSRSAENAISVWAKKSALPDKLRDDLRAELDRAFTTVRQAIDRQTDTDASAHTYDTDKDHVLTRLSELLARRIGAPLPSEEHEKALREAESRIRDQQPPGYLDHDKDPDLRVGDYLVWEQLLCEAAGRECDVLFVTSDTKDDWWERSRDELRGPRHELSVEFRERTGRRLFMVQPQDLLRHANSLDVEVDPKSADEVARVLTSWGRDVEDYLDYWTTVADPIRGPASLIRAVCGDGWTFVPGSLRARPPGCRVTDGRSTHYLFWGPLRDFQTLLWAAMDAIDPPLDMPIVVLLTPAGEAIDTDHNRRGMAIAERSGVRLRYMIVSPDPNQNFEEHED